MILIGNQMVYSWNSGIISLAFYPNPNNLPRLKAREIIRIWTKRAWNYSLTSLVTIWLHIITPFFRSHWPRAKGDRGRLTSKSLGSKKSLILGDYRLNAPLTHWTDDQFVSNVGARIYKSANLRCIRAQGNAQGAIGAITVTRPLVVQRHVVTSDSFWTVFSSE